MDGCILMILCTVMINFALSAFAFVRYKRKMSLQYHEFLQKADQILGGEAVSFEYDESLDSAIFERLNRIVEITRMQKEAAEGERDTIKSLLSNISHQIRTPLTNITLYAGLLREQQKNSEDILLADKIEKNAGKLEFFMKELQNSSYAEHEMISVTPKNVPLDRILNKSCQSVELNAMKRNIRIKTEYDNCMVFADPKWTEEVFTNIIENAVKYSQNDTEIIVRLNLYESFAGVQIIDQGIGIPEQEQGKIFQRFYRGTNVTDKQGFGIGLYLAREVLRKQQGYMKITSTLNKGTTAEVFLSRRKF